MIPDFITMGALVWTKDPDGTSEAQYATVMSIEPETPVPGHTTVRYNGGEWWYSVLDSETGKLVSGVEVAQPSREYFRHTKIAELCAMMFNQSDEVVDAMLVLAKGMAK